MDIQRPQGNGYEHPTVETLKRFSIFLVGKGMESPDVFLRIFPPMVGKRVELF